MEFQADPILRHYLTRQPCSVEGLLAFLDVLLCRSTLISKPDDPVWFHWQVDDNESHAGNISPG
jgi:hypothetical protein